MNCIFCKSDSSTCKSVEHIFPESLGNTEHVLPKGVVCDACNQYFASKIEKKVLETQYFVLLRHTHDISSKKKRIPLGVGILGGQVAIEKSSLGRSVIIDDPRIIKGVQDGTIKHMIIPTVGDPEPNDITMCRLLGKIGLEIVASMIIDTPDLLNAFVRESLLDPIRNFVRYGSKPHSWEYSQRRIHEAGAYFQNPAVSNEVYQTLHEVKIIYVKSQLVAVIGIMGIEYAINLETPAIDSYMEWLAANDRLSPLEDGRLIVNKSYSDWERGDNLRFTTPG